MSETDPFQALGLAHQLVIAPEKLEEVIRSASKAAHPDAGGDAEDFERVRKAGDILKSPPLRLKAAVQLAGGNPSGRGSVPGEVMDLFSPVAEGLQAVEKFIADRAAARSELGKAVLDAQIPTLKQNLERLQERLGELGNQVAERFAQFDEAGWEASRESMAEAARALTFLGKWQGEIRAATGKLFEALLGG